MNEIRFAVVGCGHIGKRHIEMIRQNAAAKLVSLIESDESQHQELYKKFSVPVYKNLEQFIKTGEKTDVICVATPNGTHISLGEKVINADIHLVIEKPMGLDYNLCKGLINKAIDRNKHIFCVMQNRYSPPSQWLKSVVKSGILGNIYHVQVNCYWNRDHRYYQKGSWRGTMENDGGPLFTQFSHFVDLLYWLFGDIKDIYSKFDNHNHSSLTETEDSGSVLFNFNNGGSGQFNYSTSCFDTNLESSITIIAENGSIKVGGQYMEKVEYCHIKDYTMPELKQTLPPNDYGAYKGSAANHHFVIQNVIETLQGKGSITTTAEEGSKVVEIINRIYAQRRLS